MPTNKKLIEIGDYIQEHGIKEACQQYNIKEATAERYYRKYKNLNPEKSISPDATKREKYDYNKEETDSEIHLELKSYELKTIDELLEYSKIDTDRWEVYKVVTNSWGSENNPCYQIKAWLRLKEESQIDVQKTCDYIIDQISNYSVPQVNFNKADSPYLFEVALVDHHLGQFSWEQEAGENYDVKIASALYDEALENLIDKVKSFDIDRILYILGNDFYNVNSQFNITVAGTFQHEDGRWQKSFDAGVMVHYNGIKRLSMIAPVDVLQIPGNHDEERIYYAGAVLKAAFMNDNFVYIDNRPISRKYYRWGKNLLGFTHGDEKIKIDRLLGLMPLEAKEDWSVCKNYEWHLGHLHSDSKMQHDIKSQNGIKIKRLPSLVPCDAWHFNKGFLHSRETQGFIWDEEKGDVMQVNYRV